MLGSSLWAPLLPVSLTPTWVSALGMLRFVSAFRSAGPSTFPQALSNLAAKPLSLALE